MVYSVLMPEDVSTNVRENAGIAPGKSVRLIDVAHAVGVSRTTVARVLLGSGKKNVRVGAKTVQAIRRAAEELDYQPNAAARQLAGKRSGVIGVVIDSCVAEIQSNRLSIMEREAAREGFRFMIGQSHDEPDRIQACVQDFASRGVDGVICVSHDYPGSAARVAHLFADLPNVVFIGKPALAGTCYVEVDTADGVRQSVRHLLSRGRRRIGLMLPNTAYDSMVRRRQGYMEELRAQGVETNGKLVWSANEVSLSADGAVQRGIDELVVAQKADAIQASNDAWAIHLIKSLKQRGVRVPDDVAVVGCDNIEMSLLCEPELTTIDQNNEALSRQAVKMLFDLIDGKQPGGIARTITPKLIIRGST